MDVASRSIHDLSVGEFLDAYMEYLGMAKDPSVQFLSDKEAQVALPGLPAFDEAVLRSRSSYEVGQTDAMLLRLNRRSSVSALVLREWQVVDFLAYKLGLEGK